MMMTFSVVAPTWANLTTCLVSESYPEPRLFADNIRQHGLITMERKVTRKMMTKISSLILSLKLTWA